MSGEDLPEDYAGAEWMPSRMWTYSAVEARFDQLRIVRGLHEMGLRDAGRIDQLVAPLLIAYERLRRERAKAVERARAKCRRGVIPELPMRLSDAQRAEENAMDHFWARLRPEQRRDAWGLFESLRALRADLLGTIHQARCVVELTRGTPSETEALTQFEDAAVRLVEFTKTVVRLLRHTLAADDIGTVDINKIH